MASQQRLFHNQLHFSDSFAHHVPGPLVVGYTERKHSDLLNAQLLRLPHYYALPKRDFFTLEIRTAHLVLEHRCKNNSKLILIFFQ
jgi:hypothetical protein